MKKTNLEFNEDRHLYFVDGIIVPSVSSIMLPLTEGFHSKIPSGNLNRARDRGKGVHGAIERYIKEKIIEPEYYQYVVQFIKFIDENEMEVVECELMLTNGIYAGTVDLVLKNKSGKLLLVDIKTTSVIHKDFVGVQLSAYKELLSYNGVDVSGTYVLQIRHDKHVYKPIDPDDKKWKELLHEHKNKVYQHS